MDNKNKYLCYFVVNFIKDLELLQLSYLKKHNLISIKPVVRFLKQAWTMGEQFDNLLPAWQVQIIYTILDEEETYLHTMIKVILE